MIVRLICRSIPERRALLSFKETPKGTNITFDCSPSGACLPCLYSEKVLSPLQRFPKSVPSIASRGSVWRVRLCIDFIATLFDPVPRRFLPYVMWCQYTLNFCKFPVYAILPAFQSGCLFMFGKLVATNSCNLWISPKWLLSEIIMFWMVRKDVFLCRSTWWNRPRLAVYAQSMVYIFSLS